MTLTTPPILPGTGNAMFFRNAREVTIYSEQNEPGTRYRVAGLLHSPDRGYEYQCARLSDGLIETVCHAPSRKVLSATTGGRRIVYHW